MVVLGFWVPNVCVAVRAEFGSRRVDAQPPRVVPLAL